MLRKYSKNFRNLDQNEFYFVSKEAMEFVQLSFELETPKDADNYLNQLKRSVAGLYTRCDRKSLYSIDRRLEDIKVHRIPSHLTTLKSVNEWMYHEHTPEITTHLAEIACDDHRVVINSSHICADGGYLASLVRGIQTEKGLSIHPSIPGSIVEMLKNELDNVRNRKDIKLSGSDEVTYLLNLKEDKSVPESSKAHYITETDDVRNLACYDRNLNKTKSLTEHMWCGLSLAFCALNNKLGPIGVNTCVDFRRFVFPQTRVSNSMTNFFGVINVVASQIDNKSLRISDLSQQFRNHFNYIVNNNALFFNYLYPIEMHKDITPAAHLSNIGPIRYKAPIKDFEITLQVNQKAAQEVAQIVTYSKLKTDPDGLKVTNNDIHYQFAYSPVIISDKLGKKIFESFRYFMCNIKPSTLLTDAYQEMKRYQSTL